MVYSFNINIKREERVKKKTGEIIKIKTAIQRKKIDYILSKIHVDQYLDKSVKDGWVPLNIETLRKVIGKDATPIINGLISEGYIVTDDIYYENRSKRYKINYDMVPKKGIKSYDNPYYEKSKNLISSLNVDKATQYIIDETHRMFNTGAVKFDNEENVRSIVSKFRNESWDKYYSQRVLIDKITGGDLTIVTDSHGNRIYGNYSNLSKEVRKHIMIDGEYTSNVDIKNSQFQFLAIEINDKHPQISNKKDAKLFYELVHTGKFYKYIEDELGMCKVEKKCTKCKKCYCTNKKYESWKVLALNWLYAENIQCRTSKKLEGIEFLFKNRFNTIYNIINKIKDSKQGKGGSILSVKMQAMEANIIKKIQIKLLKKGINCLSIHDSIYVSKSNKCYLNEVIEDLFKYGISLDGVHIEDNNNNSKKYNKDKFGIGNRKDRVSYDGYLDQPILTTNIKIEKKDDNLIKNEKKYDDIIKNYDSYISEMRKLLIN